MGCLPLVFVGAPSCSRYVLKDVNNIKYSFEYIIYIVPLNNLKMF
jgi:hypothetical protein